MMKFFKFALVAAAALILAGCEDEKPKKFVTFHIANPMWIESANSRSQMTMPLSGLNLVVNNIEFMYSGDLDRIDLAQVRTADGGVIDGFLFVCNDRGKKRLYTQTASNLNAYVVAMYDKKPIAARKIDGVVSDGKIFAISELPTDTDLVKFKDEMNESIKTAEELKNEN